MEAYMNYIRHNFWNRLAPRKQGISPVQPLIYDPVSVLCILPCMKYRMYVQVKLSTQWQINTFPDISCERRL